MKRIKLPNAPTTLPLTANVEEVQTDKGTRVRTILEIGERLGDNFTVYAQAYEMTAEGNFVAAPNGYPSRTDRSGHSIPMSALGDTHTLMPGFVRYTPPAPQPGVPDAPKPPTPIKVATLPATGKEGDVYEVGTQLFTWSEGFSFEIAKGKARQLENILGSSLALSGLAFRGKPTF